MFGIIRQILLSVSLLVGTAFGAIAHPLYVALPSDTVTDYLETSPIVVLAVQSPSSPYRFEPSVWLKGESTANLPKIPNIVDSSTRRRFQTGRVESVLFTFDPEKQEWKRLVNVTAPVRELVDDILENLPSWTEGKDDQARFAFFKEIHAHPDEAVRRLALVELTQSRYSLIRTMTPEIGFHELDVLLANPQEIPFSPLYVSMLGLMDDEDARARIRRVVDRTAQYGMGSRFTPWATALIEIDGAAAIDKLSAIALRSSHRDTAEAALTALALHGTEGRVALREEIAAILARAAQIDSAFAANAVSTLVEWQDWRAAETAEGYLRGGSPMGLRERMVLTSYLALAQKAGRENKPTQ